VQIIKLPKSPHGDHNTVSKNSTEQSIAQCQHPAGGTHIHVVEQVRPLGMKNNGKKQLNTSQQQKLQGKKLTRQCRATIQRAVPVKKHNHPYQIEKIDVPQHQP